MEMALGSAPWEVGNSGSDSDAGGFCGRNVVSSQSRKGSFWRVQCNLTLRDNRDGKGQNHVLEKRKEKQNHVLEQKAETTVVRAPWGVWKSGVLQGARQGQHKGSQPVGALWVSRDEHRASERIFNSQ